MDRDPAEARARAEPEAPSAPFVTVRSVWKVFGDEPEKALDPAHAGKDKAFFQQEFGHIIGLENVSFDVQRGATFVVMGLSGSGKSTLVRCLIRLIEPTAGTIVIDGADIMQMNDQELMEFRRQKIAMVFQHYGLLPHRNVLDNAAWGLEIQGLEKEERYARTAQVLELVGLRGWEDAYPGQLSGGMQQRVGLARALAVDTDILLMDEPFSGLDPLIRRELQDELLRLQTELHKTIIFITHDLDEALKLGDEIVILHDGRVAQHDAPEGIVLNPANQYVKDFTQDVRRESVLTASQIMESPTVTVRETAAPAAALQAMAPDGCSWIVDGQERYIGLLTARRANQARVDGVKRFDEAWEYVDRDFTAAAADTSLEVLIPWALSREYPIPIVDADNRLVGEASRAALAQVLTVDAEAEPSQEESS